MSKIESLTKDQEVQLIAFRDECLQIGLSTAPINRDIKTHKSKIDYIYKNYLKLPPPAIWYVDSPLTINLLLNFVFSNLRSNLRSNLWSNLRSNLRSNLGSNL